MNRNVAILMTCFNRKIKTLNCLTSLFNILPNCDVYLVDDGSNDGTSDAVKIAFPQVNVIQGTGNLFWSRGMHLAWKEASKCDYDYYLWLNDDVILHEYWLDELLGCYEISGVRSIICGLVESIDRSRILYGGFNSSKEMIQFNGMTNTIKFMNGNVVLVPKEVFKLVGNLDPAFHHDLGDVDYGLRAIAKDIKVLSTRRPIAIGNPNTINRERLHAVSVFKRFKKLYSPLGSPPALNFIFRKRHFGVISASLYWMFQHVINVLPDWALVAFLKKYKR